MESKQKALTDPKTGDSDIDLGQLFNKTGNVINNFFGALGKFFAGLGKILLLFLFLIRKNLLWLAIGTVIGLSYGVYLVHKNGNNYYSEITLRTNFNSGRTLYAAIDFFNALIGNGQLQELAATLNITEKEASRLLEFSGSPVNTEMITAEMYKQQFLDQNYNVKLRTDTFWTKTITYKDFKAALTKYDYPVHQIRVISNDPSIFPKIQQGVINYISNNEMLKEARENEIDINRQETKLLESSLQSLDTLRSTYNKRLATAATNAQGTNLTVLDGPSAMHSPELEVYDKVLQLKDELRSVKIEGVVQRNIVEVYAPFGKTGQRLGFLERKAVRYSLYGFLGTLLIIIFLSLYNFLSDLEKRYSKPALKTPEK